MALTAISERLRGVAQRVTPWELPADDEKMPTRHASPKSLILPPSPQPLAQSAAHSDPSIFRSVLLGGAVGAGLGWTRSAVFMSYKSSIESNAGMHNYLQKSVSRLGGVGALYAGTVTMSRKFRRVDDAYNYITAGTIAGTAIGIASGSGMKGLGWASVLSAAGCLYHIRDLVVPTPMGAEARYERQRKFLKSMKQT